MSGLAVNNEQAWTRNTIQSRLLSEIFAKHMETFVLKGGMAMRAKHNSFRTTQDIDLDAAPDFDLYFMQKLIRKAIKRTLASNMLENVEITEPKQTDTKAKWKIRGVVPETQQHLNFLVEVSRRDDFSEDQIENIEYKTEDNYKIRPLRIYKDKFLAFKKIKAMMAIDRDAPRDISDLYVLITANVEPPINELSEWLKKSKNSYEEMIQQMWYKIECMDKEKFEKEVLPSLPDTEEVRVMYGDWEKIRLEVGTTIEEWFRLAQTKDSFKVEKENNKNFDKCHLNKSSLEKAHQNNNINYSKYKSCSV